jgi:hypothetical protein
LLRTKAKQLLARKEEVVIISFEDKESSKNSLLFDELRAEFNDKVSSLRGSGNKYHKKGSDDMSVCSNVFLYILKFWVICLNSTCTYSKGFLLPSSHPLCSILLKMGAEKACQHL